MRNDSHNGYPPPSREQRRRRRRRQARRRFLLLIGVTAVVVAVAAVGASALLRAHGGGTSDAGATPAKKTSRSTPPPKVWVASARRPVRVWIGGDSMGGELGWSLGPMLDRLKVFKPVAFYKESSGICRYDFFDWHKEIASVVKTRRPQAAVIMLGANDTQSISRSGGAWIPYGGAAWKKAYQKRVGEIMDTLLRGGTRRIYWVGMPVMGEDWRNPRMRVIDGIFRKQAEGHPGAEYIDIWRLFTRPDGSFDPSLRLSDGVHFTVGGQRKLARVVLTAIEADWLPAGHAAPQASPSAGSSSPAP